jgi:hypothetical protein
VRFRILPPSRKKLRQNTAVNQHTREKNLEKLDVDTRQAGQPRALKTIPQRIDVHPPTQAMAEPLSKKQHQRTKRDLPRQGIEKTERQTRAEGASSGSNLAVRKNGKRKPTAAQPICD